MTRRLPKSPVHGETYASTASFLLRLLVDDRHVCLVAVAKPIPEPSAPLPDLVSSRANISVPDSPRSADNASSGAASPLSSSPSIDGLESLNLATASVAAHDDDDDDDEDDDEEEEQSSLSSSPGPPSLFSISKGDGVPAAPHTRMINPRGRDGRINNTPATSVFSDIFAERGHPPSSLNKHALPGPTEPAPVRKVLNVPPPRSLSSDSKPVETETILGVVSAQLTVVTAPSEDSLFSSFKKGGGEGDKGGGEEATGVIDIHLLTLATSPEERGQGLGAKLLSALHGECMIKARHMALRMRSQIPGITIPHVSPLSPKFIDEPTTATVMTSQVASTSCSTSNASTVGGLKASEVIAAMRCSSYLRTLGGVEWTLAELKDPIAAPIGKYLTRMYLEVHPSNIHALALYRAHGFVAPNDDSKAVKRGFYRGDLRIATAERTKRGGTDAWILQRFDGALST
ncbi:uncharacterized protein MEPE_03478 [Melanopsichium pennsylvanicum]|uniref:Uncharacterized protein n=1 Tax=Melanopsichium pennsylvanicum TaxID=63383 RepID=A0AAJ4XLW8_9BASI|nr:uncharacterized protein MEPE_03478 [Melanopsichium pennsylvanicum]